MISGSLSLEDMRLLVAMALIFQEAPGQPLSLTDISERLKGQGFTVGNGMTREIDDLEAKLGGNQKPPKKLLNRGRKGSTPTQMFLDIVPQLRAVLGIMDEIQATVDSDRSIVRVGLTNSLATNIFPRVLKETTFLTKYPYADIEIVEGEPHELVNLLQTRVDFAVGPKDFNNGFQSRPLCQWKRVLLYSRNVVYRHDFSKSVPIPVLKEWLRDEVLLLPAPRIIPQIEKFLKPMQKGQRFIVPQAALRRLWVERGIGLAISYEESRGINSMNDPIRSIDLSSELGTTEMHLYHRPNHKLSEAAAALMDAIFSIFSREQGDVASPGAG